jgi:Cys-rich four helix bundle protein (predicted Tat secretion target)
MINRRDALLTTGSMVVSASVGAIACGSPSAVAQNTPPRTPPSPSGGPGGKGDPAIMEAAHNCMLKGEACLSHCLDLLSTGDTSMNECSHAVRVMSAMMTGLAAVASQGSSHLPDVARVASQFCKDCEAACRKHADVHLICKECMDACTKTIAACQRVTA